MRAGAVVEGRGGVGGVRTFYVFVQHTAQRCGTRNAVKSVYAIGDHAQSSGIDSAFIPLQVAGGELRGNRNTM